MHQSTGPYPIILNSAPAEAAALRAQRGKFKPLDPRLRGHVPALDAIRGLAIVLVTMYRFHPPVSNAGPWESAFASVVTSFSHGVDLFFVLSGFLITGILYDSKQKPAYFRSFYLRRTLRIFPLYYAVLLFSLVILPRFVPTATSHYPLAYEQPIWLWLYSANLQQVWHGGWCLGVFDHFWSLAVEEHFYVIWPLVIFATSRESAMRVCNVLFLGCAAGRAIWLVAGGSDVGAEVFTLFRFDALALGSWLALAARGPCGLHDLRPVAQRMLTLGLMASPILIWWPSRMLALPGTLFAALSAGLVIGALTDTEGGLLHRIGQSRVLQFFGKYSYGMYIFQKPLIVMMEPFLQVASLTAVCGSPLMARAGYMLAMFAITTVLAIASFHLFEEHITRLKHRFS